LGRRVNYIILEYPSRNRAPERSGAVKGRWSMQVRRNRTALEKTRSA